MPAPSFFERLGERKLVQWTLAYLAGAWVVFEVADGVGGRWNLPDVFFQGLFIVLVVGALVTLLLAWYHGERGQQTVSGSELLLLAVLLSLGGFTLSRLGRGSSAANAATPALLQAGPLAISSLDDPAVAVLPFAMLGDDQSDEFADGMHEEVLHAVAQVSGLIVKSRQSVLQYKGSREPMAEIARDLRADAIVEGSVRTAGEQVRVTVQLINTRSDAHLWSKTYDRTLSAANLFDIQEEVAREIARALEVTLTSDDSLRLGRRATLSLDARTVFLQAKAAQRVSEPEARRLLRLAIAMDSTYDRPWGLLAELEAANAFAIGDVALADSAVALAQKALSLDPTRSSGDAHNAIGFARMAQGRLAEARTAFATGMRHVPNDPALTSNFGAMHSAAGMYPEAVAAWRRGIEISPGHIGVRANLAELYATLGLRERAERVLGEAWTLQPAHEMVVGAAAILQAIHGEPGVGLATFSEWEAVQGGEPHEAVLRTGATIAIWAGDFARAEAYAVRALEMTPDALPLLGGHMAHVLLGFLRTKEGSLERAEAHLAKAYDVLEPMVSGGTEFAPLATELAAIEAIRGNVDAATRWFTRAFELGFRNVREIELDPMFEPLFRDPEFERIMARMRAHLAEMREQVVAMEAELQ